MDKETRLYLNDLSLKLFGKSSLWVKLYNRGKLSLLTEKLEDETERKYKGIKYPTVDEIQKELEFKWNEKQEENKKNTKTSEEIGEKV